MNHTVKSVAMIAIGVAALTLAGWRAYTWFAGSPEEYFVIQAKAIPLDERPDALNAKYDEVEAQLNAARNTTSEDVTRLEGELADAAERRGKLTERWNRSIQKAKQVEFLIGFGSLVSGIMLSWIGLEQLRSRHAKVA